MNVLFVCSRNKWRSRTAEEIFKNNGLHMVKSVGTATSARVKVNQRHMYWADIIFAMEKKHKSFLTRMGTENTPIYVLDIPDEYLYMDEELIEILKISVKAYLPEL